MRGVPRAVWAPPWSMAGAERGVERGKDMAGPDWRIRGVVGRRADALKDCVDRGVRRSRQGWPCRLPEMRPGTWPA